MTHYKAVTLTLTELWIACNYYMPLLGINHWDIDICITRLSALDGNDGDCTWTLTKLRATIRIMNPDDNPKDDDPLDMEYVLVHELIHVAMATINAMIKDRDDVIRDGAIEQFVHSMALALVRQRRAGTHKFSWEQRKRSN